MRLQISRQRTIGLLAGLVVLTAGATGCGSGGGKSSGSAKYVIKYNNIQSLASPEGQGMQYFKQQVEKNSGGRIRVDMYPDGVLGPATGEVTQVASNVTQVTGTNIPNLAQYVDTWNFFGVPMVFASADAVKKGYQSDAVKGLEQQLLDKSGVKVLAYEEAGFVQFINKVHPIVTPADVKGLKFRIIPGSEPLESSFKLLGAQPVPVASTETYTGEQAGLINATENPINVLHDKKDYENLKYLTILNFQYNPEPIVINAKFFNGLPSDLQKVVSDAAVASAQFETDKVDGSESADIQAMQQAGVKVTRLTDEQRDAFVVALKPYLQTAIAKYGANLFEAFGVDANSL